MDAIGKQLACDYQPYGPFTILIDEIGSYNGHPWVAGKCVSGHETSRLFQHRSTSDITGQRRTVYGIKDSELQAGRCVRVAS